MREYTPDQIRNVAIIAHIDHGKTTIINSLLKASNIFRENEAIPDRAMDSNDLEKERGITIFAKHTSLYYKDFKINLIDTPGHADFSGEVERVLGMVNSVLLLVDAKEGPMPQTRFVLSQALKMGMNPIVVLNKIDRPQAQPDIALDRTFDLFVELGANDEQLDFAYIYASGLAGFAMKGLDDPRESMDPLFDMILEKVPSPTGNADLPFLMQVSTLGYDEFVGRQATGRILEGRVKKGDMVTCIEANGHPSHHKIVRVEGYHGLQKGELDKGTVGDIVSISGIPEVMIGDTLCSPDKIEQLPPITLQEPTLSVEISVNNGPFAGREGKHVTMNKIRDRLFKERRANISLKIEEVRDDAMRVSGRGELHLAVLIESMRREGYEFLISKPKVILHEVDGAKEEPIEVAHIEVPEAYSGAVIEELSSRKGEMRMMETNEHGITSLEFLIPTRGLMGYRNTFLTVTKGEGIMTSLFDSYAGWRGQIPGRKNGALIAMARGKCTPFASVSLQDRGSLFVSPGEEIYEGMVVGAHNRDNDLIVNITKEKQLNNIRSSSSEGLTILTPPIKFNLEQALDFIQDDELIEVTPKNIRLRKTYLTENERKRNKKS